MSHHGSMHRAETTPAICANFCGLHKKDLNGKKSAIM
jgi:hypothetical protein